MRKHCRGVNLRHDAGTQPAHTSQKATLIKNKTSQLGITAG